MNAVNMDELVIITDLTKQKLRYITLEAAAAAAEAGKTMADYSP